MLYAHVAINGHRLPDLLVEAMIRGWWRTPADPNPLRPFFPASDEHFATMLYNLAVCASETRALMKSDEPGVGAEPPTATAPGRVEGHDLVAVGDLGIDAPIALHYGVGEEPPSIVYLTSRGWFAADAELSDLVECLRALGIPGDES